jgi:hypothetical protein
MESICIGEKCFWRSFNGGLTFMGSNRRGWAKWKWGYRQGFTLIISSSTVLGWVLWTAFLWLRGCFPCLSHFTERITPAVYVCMYVHSAYIHTFVITYSVEQNLSPEGNRFLASQEILCILRNTNLDYGIHKCPPPVPFLSQINTVHALTFQFLKIPLNIIFPSTPESSS